MTLIEQLRRIGQSPRLDHITRGFLTSGRLCRFMQEFFVIGFTSKATIFYHAIKNSYDRLNQSD